MLYKGNCAISKVEMKQVRNRTTMYPYSLLNVFPCIKRNKHLIIKLSMSMVGIHMHLASIPYRTRSGFESGIPMQYWFRSTFLLLYEGDWIFVIFKNLT